MALVNMKISKEDREKERTPEMSEADGPEYPFGLRLHLDSNSLKKLGIENLPETGKEFGIEAKAKVVEVSQRADEEYTDKRMELQVTDMNLVDPDASTADRLFSGGAKSE